MMANSLYNQFNNQSNGNISKLIADFQNFKNTFKGDARQQVEKMVASGIIPQSVFNDLAKEANMIMSFLPK